MNAAILFCIILSQSLFAYSCHRFAPKDTGQSAATASLKTDVKRVWRSANYRGLTMGRSFEDEMLRIFGTPTKSELFNEGTSNPEVWHHYEGSLDFPGTLRVVVDKATNIVQAVDLHPKDLKKEEAIKHFGPDYIVTKYDFDSCLGDEESAPLFESAKGAVVFIEYRQRGIALALNGQGKVDEIRYVGEPIGTESSKCK
jgi:hypothetical protein